MYSANEKLMLSTLSDSVSSCGFKPVPVWFMRQAGRHLPQYRDIREGRDFLQDCLLNEEFITLATLQPIKEYDLDGAVIFSDILVIPLLLGMGIEYNKGARVKDRLLSQKDCSKTIAENAKTLEGVKFPDPDFSKTSPLYKALGRVGKILPREKTLIGFCPAPWTILCYMMEEAKPFERTVQLAKESPQTLRRLLMGLVEVIREHAQLQMESGADCVQIFDSWGHLMPEDFFQDHYRWIIEKLRLGMPSIYFGKHDSWKDKLWLKDNFSCVSVGENTALEEAKLLQEQGLCLQGNLSPQLLLEGGADMLKQTERILEALGKSGKLIFNLGHGVLPDTPVEHVRKVVEKVRMFGG